MEKPILTTGLLTSLLTALDKNSLSALLGIVLRLIVSVEVFRRKEITPRTFERRLERLGRELDRLFLEANGYLTRYRQFMDYAERRKAGDPIGSGITEAGCKVIFNQRMKQSGMRWNHRGGQNIVDLRTACRSGLWDRIWRRWQDSQTDLPPIIQPIPQSKLAAA